jgi:hypothetical protein
MNSNYDSFAISLLMLYLGGELGLYHVVVSPTTSNYVEAVRPPDFFQPTAGIV